MQLYSSNYSKQIIKINYKDDVKFSWPQGLFRLIYYAVCILTYLSQFAFIIYYIAYIVCSTGTQGIHIIDLHAGTHSNPVL